MKINHKQFEYLSKMNDLILETIAKNQDCIFYDSIFISHAFSFMFMVFQKSNPDDIDLSTKQINLYVDYVVEKLRFYAERNSRFPGCGVSCAVDFLKQLGFLITDPITHNDKPVVNYASKKRFYVLNKYDKILS